MPPAATAASPPAGACVAENSTSACEPRTKPAPRASDPPLLLLLGERYVEGVRGGEGRPTRSAARRVLSFFSSSRRTACPAPAERRAVKTGQKGSNGSKRGQHAVKSGQSAVNTPPSKAVKARAGPPHLAEAVERGRLRLLGRPAGARRRRRRRLQALPPRPLAHLRHAAGRALFAVRRLPKGAGGGRGGYLGQCVLERARRLAGRGRGEETAGGVVGDGGDCCCLGQEVK
jgi:hypothetical protein